MRTHIPTILTLSAALLSPLAAGASPRQEGPVVRDAARRLLTVPSPCPGPRCEIPADQLKPQAKGLRIVYLNFDGVSLTASTSTDDALTNKSAIVAGALSPGQILNIPAFDPSSLGDTQGLTRAQIIARVVDDLYASHAPYNIEFVTTRPASGNYSMVVFGGTCVSVAGQGGCAGIALRDCGDFLPNNITFAFPGGLSVDDLAATAAQEEAHAFGLAHTDDDTDIMYPYLQPSFTPTQFGSGNIPDSSGCGNQVFQDSDQTMMDTIGYRGQDLLGPNITITAPVSGDVVHVGDTVSAEINDPADVARATLSVNGVEVAEKTSAPWSFSIPSDTTTGPVNLVIRAYDGIDNLSQASVNAYIPTGDETPCDNGLCPGDLECVSDLCVPGDGVGNLGATCDSNEECESLICGELDGEKRCSQTCSAEVPCPDGFRCAGDVACWPAEDEGGCGCGATRDGGQALASILLGLAAMFMVTRRRRA